MKEEQKIGGWISTSLVLGNMVGSGIFMLPATLALYGGISIIGWLLSSTGALLLALLFASLSRSLPLSGGPYVYARHGFGDFAGFLVAWGYWLSICTTNAAIAVAVISYLTVFFPLLENSPILSLISALSAVWILTWINIKGLRTAGAIQLITTILKIIPLILIAIIGLFYMDMDNFSPLNVSGESHLSAITHTATLTLFAFLGIESATIPAESVKDAKRTIPRSTIIGTLLAILVYVISSTVVMGIIPMESLQQSEAPFADTAMIIWGPQARYWVALGAVISTIGALNGWILLQGQFPMAVAKDQLFHRSFARLNSNGAPVSGLVISSVFVSLIIGLNFHKGFVRAFEFMILLSTLTALVPYLFSSVTHILISRRAGNRWWGILGTLTFLFSLWAVIGSGQEVVFWGFIGLMCGLPVYIWIKIHQEHKI